MHQSLLVPWSWDRILLIFNAILKIFTSSSSFLVGLSLACYIIVWLPGWWKHIGKNNKNTENTSFLYLVGCQSCMWLMLRYATFVDSVLPWKKLINNSVTYSGGRKYCSRSERFNRRSSSPSKWTESTAIGSFIQVISHTIASDKLNRMTKPHQSTDL